MLIFTERELTESIVLDQKAITAVKEGFSKLAQHQVEMPPVMRIDFPECNGEVDVKTAHMKGKEMFAIKVSSGFFDNPKIGLPSGSGFMMLMSTQTGIPQALLLDNGYLTEIRTAAAGAIAADCLSLKEIKTVGIIGAGSQARWQLKALMLVRDFPKVLVYARSAERVARYAEEMSAMLGLEVQAAESAEQVVRNSQLVVTTTPATEPVVKAEWLHPGLHITAMGSDAGHKQELEASVLAAADKIICDAKAQCMELGELHHALKAGMLKDVSEVMELGQLTSKELKGRDDDAQITVCDLTGTGVQDTAIALFAYGELKKQQIGLHINEHEGQEN